MGKTLKLLGMALLSLTVMLTAGCNSGPKVRIKTVFIQLSSVLPGMTSISTPFMENTSNRELKN